MMNTWPYCLTYNIIIYFGHVKHILEHYKRQLTFLLDYFFVEYF